MKINMRVIAEFQSETGRDYMQIAMAAINAFQDSEGEEPIKRAQIMTEAVSMHDTAWLFYLAAKQMNNLVKFSEIQEAVLFEGPLLTEDEDVVINKAYKDEKTGEEHPEERGNVIRQSYPLIFTSLIMFSTLGIQDRAKK